MVTKTKTIIAWVILILFLLSSGLYAQDDGLMLEQPLTTNLLWSPIDTLWGYERDTTRCYIKEIKQKCDTTYHRNPRINVLITPNICDSGILHCGCGRYTTYRTEIKCQSDTVWADKVQVWLTPEQLKRLMKVVDAESEVTTVFPNVYYMKLKE